MIKEVESMHHFDALAKKWNNQGNRFFWTHQSCRQGRHFDPDSIESYLRNMLNQSLFNPDVLPHLKIWSYEQNDTAIAGCVFLGNKNFMMNENIFEEVLWQTNGEYAKSIKQRKIMIELLKCAENYARKAGYKVMSVSRDPRLHNFTIEKNSGINNYYTRNNYEAAAIQYFKTLN